MKRWLVGCMAAAVWAVGSCERHAWEETRQLHQPHGGHAGGAGHGAGPGEQPAGGQGGRH